MVNEIPDYSSENLKWLRRQVGKASSSSDFDQVELDIENDIFEGEPWTKDEARVRIIKQLVERKRHESNA
jgi:hypothetical protein